MDNDSLIVVCPVCGTKNRIPLQKMSRRALCGKCRNTLVTKYRDEDVLPIEVNEMNFQKVILLAGEYEGKVKFAKLNVDENPRIASQYNIRSVPSMLIFNNGRLMNSVVGALPKAEIMRHIEAVI